MNQLIENATRIYGPDSPTSVIGSQNELMLSVNKVIVSLYGHLFFPNKRLHMAAKTVTFQGEIVHAEVVKLKYTLEFDQIQKSSHIAPEARVEQIVRGITTELFEMYLEISKQGKVVMPFIPVMGAVVINPNTFEPDVRFSTMIAMVNIDGTKPLDLPLRQEDFAPLLQNVEREMAIRNDQSQYTNSEAALVKRLNVDLMTRYGNQLFSEPSRYMQGPVCLFNNNAVSAASRSLATRLTFDHLFEGYEADDLSDTVDKIAAEMIAERDATIAAGKVIYPYVPITSSGILIDPLTFLPSMSFKTRYGIDVNHF